jgi:Icc protein
MHHPPAFMAVPFMDDTHALEDREEILQLLIDQGTPIHVFCGHYHVHKSSFIQNVAIHVTPSLYVQIDQYQSDFTIDHKSIAFRMINIEEGLKTTVHYLPGNHPGG